MVVVVGIDWIGNFGAIEIVSYLIPHGNEYDAIGCSLVHHSENGVDFVDLDIGDLGLNVVLGRKGNGRRRRWEEEEKVIGGGGWQREQREREGEVVIERQRGNGDWRREGETVEAEG
ncbi:hypothetical protein ACH5RR_021565 [Cinchona calisaya]|uniref:Uncharacterized protein n=1 Tax=Cinchona calisaya TaxID=153742 RepID=A0ABD2ZHM9_9GENT